MSAAESEWQTRKKRIDPKLDEAGWPKAAASKFPAPRRSEEEPTANGPADYALWLDGAIVAVVEAKKVTLGPQNVLTQAARYAKGIVHGPYDFQGHRVPFLYSTNGEEIWFQDVRHPLNRSRRVGRFHTPQALAELLAQDFDGVCDDLLALPQTSTLLRPYQVAATSAVEKAIAERKRSLLVAMATGTGKTFTLVNLAYRLMKSGAARRILFLVDRRALAAQAVRAFASFEAEPGQKFDQIYEVYSSRFQQNDFGDDEKFDPKVLPNSYLTDPQAKHAFVYVCTIQRMAINVLGRNAIPALGEEIVDEDAEALPIPIHAFDCVIADECHRGYSAQEISVWRSTLDHLDAVRIGLTATPAAHTAAYFTHKVFEYPYEQAVREGYLVDWDLVKIRSEVRMQGVFLHEGENVELVDSETGQKKLDQLEDERAFDTAEIESKVTAPESNKKILEEIARFAAEHEKVTGRFPKTLIFAANDLPHTSHADQLVHRARDIFGRGDAFVAKITGRVDRPLQRIREFRNRPEPMVVVTVDLLTTGVDIPDLEFIVMLRPVKSRILFVQMLGRGTRKGERHPDKEKFTVFDCFDGTLVEYFKNTTDMTTDLPAPPSRTTAEIIEAIWRNEDRRYNTGCLVKRLQRIDRQMSAEARELFTAWIEQGDVGKFARELPRRLEKDFAATMALLRDSKFQELLENYPRAKRTFVNAYGYADTVTSAWLIRDGLGHEHKPDDYLALFAKYVQENVDQIDAIRILLGRKHGWSADALQELKTKLKSSPYRFTEDNLEKAFERSYGKALVDLISMVKRAALEDAPLLTATERVDRALARVTAGHAFTAAQSEWLNRIRGVLQANLSIAKEDFEGQPALAHPGGWGAAERAFGRSNLEMLIVELNEALAA